MPNFTAVASAASSIMFVGGLSSRVRTRISSTSAFLADRETQRRLLLVGVSGRVQSFANGFKIIIDKMSLEQLLRDPGSSRVSR
ncbi:MAG: hypothetical protein IPM79_20870 [Polyangiaceae bacterium]|nr:hypothetical protein [Polyangiaceae bacterium]